LKPDNNYYIDTHAHLDMLKGKSPEQAVKDAMEQNVKYIINTASNIEGSISSVKYTSEFKNVFATVGVHPHHADTFSKNDLAILEDLLISCDKILAVGECGYDFFNNPISFADQRNAFTSQIELSLKHKKPIVIHDRQAHGETLDIIRQYHGEKSFKAVLHCFSGDVDFAFKCLELGLFISFTGVITFPSAKILKEVVKQTPLSRIFIETDSPFLAPQPKRGKENYPEYVVFVAEEIALLKGVDLSEVARITSANAAEFFNLI